MNFKIDEAKIECDYLYSYAAEMGIPYEKYREAYLRDEVAKLRNPYAFAELEEDDALYNTKG
jgi:hypothetical protein